MSRCQAKTLANIAKASHGLSTVSLRRAASLLSAGLAKAMAIIPNLSALQKPNNWSITVEEIDWSKIVEDAEFAGSIFGEQLPVFYKNVTDSSYEYHYPSEGGWSCPVIGKPACRPLIERPSTPWNSQGLPPVGTVCEWRHGESHAWQQITIVAYHSDSAWVLHKNSKTPDTIKVRGKSYFRPIRTHEQIAADEREAAVNGMLCYDALGGSRRGLAEALYDAGYRKP